MYWHRLSTKEDIKILQITHALADVFDIVIRRMISVQVKIFSISFFAREEQGNCYRTNISSSETERIYEMTRTVILFEFVVTERIGRIFEKSSNL